MMNPFTINGKVALITGGLGGIAVSYAKHLMCNGIRGIVLADCSCVNYENIVEELETCGKGDVYYVQTNVMSEEQIRDAFEQTVRRFNQLDIFISNAGVIHERVWKKMITANFIGGIKGIFMALKEYLPKYKSCEETVIVQTSCVTALQPLQSLAAYSSTKCGMMGFHRALSNEYWYKKFGSRFLAICPGITNTGQYKQLASKGIDLDLYDEECSAWLKQDPDICGVCLVKALRKGKNGSIWICEGDEIYEWEIPDRMEVRKRIMTKPAKDDPRKTKK